MLVSVSGKPAMLSVITALVSAASVGVSAMLVGISAAPAGYVVGSNSLGIQ
jgi:hypothetical protein